MKIHLKYNKTSDKWQVVDKDSIMYQGTLFECKDYLKETK